MPQIAAMRMMFLSFSPLICKACANGIQAMKTSQPIWMGNLARLSSSTEAKVRISSLYFIVQPFYT